MLGVGPVLRQLLRLPPATFLRPSGAIRTVQILKTLLPQMSNAVSPPAEPGFIALIRKGCVPVAADTECRFLLALLPVDPGASQRGYRKFKKFPHRAV